MRKFLIFLGIWMIAFAAHSREDWYDEPLNCNPGTIEIDNLPQNTAQATVVVSFKCKNSDATVSLLWDYADVSNNRQVKVKFPAKHDTDEIYGKSAVVSVMSIEDGVARQLAQADVPITQDFFTIRIVCDKFNGRVYAGSETTKLIGEIDGAISGGQVLLESDSRLAIRRLSSQPELINLPNHSRFFSIAALQQHLAASTDPNEGVWCYLDRDINEDKANFGGKYEIATVGNDDGDYDIVYLSGAEKGGDIWYPLSVRGTLSPTLFEGNFNLIWRDASGVTLDDDNNAQLSDGGTILTLRFPVLKSQIRFFRRQ